MSLAASWALQKGLYQRLTATSALTSQISRIADDPPPDAPLPLLTIGEDSVTDWSTKSFAGSEHRFALLLWTASADRKTAKTLGAVIQSALASPPLALAEGFTLVSLRFQSARTARDSDGRRTLLALDYRARIIAPQA
jgi:hypothetical protein